MTKSKNFLAILALLGSLMVLQACGGNTQPAENTATDQPATEEAAQTPADTQAPEGQGPEYTSAYVCPMHCAGSGSDQPGKCPSCGMDYIASADQTDHGHDHHDGHDHQH